jgi:hypothetical protein
MVAAVLNGLPPRFDTHTVEKRTLRLHTIEFANELIQFSDSDDPLHRFSAAFAKWIDSTFQGQIRQTQKIAREPLGGEVSRNQEWEKIVGQVPIR